MSHSDGAFCSLALNLGSSKPKNGLPLQPSEYITWKLSGSEVLQIVTADWTRIIGH